MKKPQTPPNTVQTLFKLDVPDVLRVYAEAVRTESESNYRHWDTLRHLEPPGGFTHEQWWAATKAVRATALKNFPLVGTNRRSFQYAIPDVLIERLHRVDLGAGGSIGMTEPVTNPQTRDQYILRSLFQEAVTSSQLEGAATTRAVAKEMIRSGRPPRTRGERMILNNYRTMQNIAAWKQRPLDPALIFEMHRMVTEGTLDDESAAGRMRKPEESVAVRDDITDEAYHYPPPAEELSERLEALCAFANEPILAEGKSPGRFLHPVVRAILLHFWLAYDHPFVDGNGRTARALFYWSMLRAKYWLFEFVSISEIILKAPKPYALSFLHAETDGNDATYFLIHQSEVICRAIESLHDYIERKSRELQGTAKLLRNVQGLNHRQQALIGHALRHPGMQYTVEGHRRSHGTVYQTARQDLLELASNGWLVRKKVGKVFIFTAPADLAERVQTKGQV